MVIYQFGEAQPIGCIIMWIIKCYISISIALKFISDFSLIKKIVVYIAR